ncbi:MAG: flavin monoamine oxidase family protein [Woeseiaceae bacterium]
MVNTQSPRRPVDRRMFLKAAGVSALTLSFLGCGRRSGELSGSVMVVGAGLSGLATAMLLEERGLDVTVLEARDRLGGRVFTLHDVPGSPEGGGPVIATSYERLLKIANAVGAEMGPGPSMERETLLHVNGEAVPWESWESSSANQLSSSERGMPPSRLLGTLTGADNPLSDWSDWINPGHSSIDISLADYLRSKGASEEALRLINVAPNTNNIETTSALWALRNAQRRRDSKGGRIVTAAGGNSMLTQKMAAAVRGPVLLGKPVVALRSLSDRVEVECSDSSKFDADFCVVTVPFSVLRTIAVEPLLSGRQKEAVEKLPYTAITKFYLRPKYAFWEDDKLPVSMWTDTLIERVFPNRSVDGQIQSLTCWVDGANAIALDAMPEDEQKATVLSELARIRPATKDALDLAGMISWGRDPWALGAYAHYAPGQVTGLKAAMAQPWHRMHLAGEHTAVTSPGLESAVESAERAAGEIIDRVS